VARKILEAGQTPLVRGKGLMATEEEERRAELYIRAVEWRFAKTMPEHPHSYTVVTWNVDKEGEFRWLAEMIKKYAVREKWSGERYSNYLYLGNYKYWIMSHPNKCILINRTDSIARVLPSK